MILTPGDLPLDNDANMQPVPAPLVSQLTYEHLLWVLIGVLAAGLRLWFLDTTPLNNAEAHQTLQSYTLATLGSATLSNPLFGTLQAWLFAISSANEFTARLISALAGTALCLLPILIRESLGRGRALALSALLALSPTVWFVSRQADGALLAWTLALALSLIWRAGRDTLSARAVLVGLLLACGADAISPLLVCAVVLAVTSERDTTNTPRIQVGQIVIAIATFVLASTGLLMHPAGLGSVFGGLAEWFKRLTTADTLSFGRAFMGLLIYELPIIIGAIGAIAMLISTRRIQRDELRWLAWIGAGLVLLVLTQGRSAIDILPIVIGLAGFAAHSLNWLFNSLRRHGKWSFEGSYTALAFVTFISAGLSIRQYASTSEASWLMLVLLSVVLSAAAITSTGMLGDMGIGVRAVVAGLALNLLLYSVATGVHLNWVKPNNPTEPYVTDAVPNDLRVLAEMVQTISTRSQGDPNMMSVQVQRSAPASLVWALRHQTEVLLTENTGDSGVVITPQDAPPAARGNSGYVGTGFIIQTQASLDSVRCNRNPTQLDCVPLARWFAFRQADAPSNTRWVVWVRGDVANKASGIQ